MMLGADVEELDQLSAQFKTAGDAIAAQGKRISSMVSRTTWKGRDASDFREHWNSVLAGQIQRAGQFLREGAAELTKQAAEQRRASEAYGGGAGGGGGGGGGGGTGGGGGGAGGGGGGGGGGGWGESGGGGRWGGWGDIFAPGISGSEDVKNGTAQSLRLDLVDYTAYEHGFLGDAGSVKLGNASGGIGFKMEDGEQYIGAFGEVSVARVDIEGNLIGNDEWGVDAGVGASVLEAEAFVGYKDGTFGAEIGGNLASVDGQIGANIAGHDVAVTGEIGLKFELGGSIGKETNLKLGPVSVGFNLGW